MLSYRANTPEGAGEFERRREKVVAFYPRAERRGGFEPSKFLLEYLPDFCWQTGKEIMTMAEAYNERADCQSLRITLGVLVRRGFIEKRIYRRGARAPKGLLHEYLRKRA